MILQNELHISLPAQASRARKRLAEAEGRQVSGTVMVVALDPTRATGVAEPGCGKKQRSQGRKCHALG